MKKILTLLLMSLFSAQTFAAKYVALTFDDGPSPKTTPQILQILKKYNAKATFFVIGQNANKNPDILKAMVKDGHQIGNHSYSHPWLTKIAFNTAIKELTSTSTIIKDNAGVAPTFFRPPGGFWNSQIQKASGMKMAMWNVDTKDRQHKNPAKTLSIIKANTKNGDIILMHDIHGSTVKALPGVMEYLKSQGYTFVTLDQLAKISPKSFHARNPSGQVYDIAIETDTKLASSDIGRFDMLLNYI